ncbi:hypothetical protein OG407_30185 [Streptomyces sp. NBC_01515]
MGPRLTFIPSTWTDFIPCVSNNQPRPWSWLEQCRG